MQKNEKPNLLLIMCDQLRKDVLSCYGSKTVKTPNIDRLARRGVCFTNSYSQTPVCIPARYETISGYNPFELDITENGRPSKVLERPLARMVRDEGYYTCAVGKMHFVPAREHHGFDRMYLSEEIPGHIDDDDYLQFLRVNGYSHVIEPHGKRSETYYVPQISELPEEMHTTAWTADKTCEVIRKNRNRPFFIFSSFIKPHPPFEPCRPYDQMYPIDSIDAPIRQEFEKNTHDVTIQSQNDYKVNGIENITDEQTMKIRSHYYGSVSQVDKQVGKIIDTLDEYGLSDNTIIIFTADHGEMLGDHYCFGKRNFYEQACNIPFIVSWPNKVPCGEYREQLVMLKDVYGTFISQAGAKIPDDTTAIDVINVCVDNNETTRKVVYGAMGREGQLKLMRRWDNYKYIYYINGGYEALYNMEKDPQEFENIAEENSDICKESKEKVYEYFKPYNYKDAIKNGKLRKDDYVPHISSGYINQYPAWPETIID